VLLAAEDSALELISTQKNHITGLPILGCQVNSRLFPLPAILTHLNGSVLLNHAQRAHHLTCCRIFFNLFQVFNDGIIIDLFQAGCEISIYVDRVFYTHSSSTSSKIRPITKPYGTISSHSEVS